MSDERKKPRPWSTESPARRWDYVIIGSGMGGMSAAALLAKLGKQVLVLEQHYVPGGFTHTFKRPGFTWDVGVHAVGEVSDKSMVGRLLRELTDGRLEWASLGAVYDEFYFPEGARIDFPDTPHQFRDNLVAAYPKEAEAIDRYIALVREVASGMRGYYLSRTAPGRWARPIDWLLARKTRDYLSMRTADVIGGLTRDPRLAATLTAQWGYYGATPSRSAFAVHALAAKHFMWGGYYPVGGSGRIAMTLLEAVKGAGGWTRIKADVDHVIVEGGRAVGVALVGGERIEAGAVISAAGIMATAARLLPEREQHERWAESVRALRPAPAHVCLYLGFEGDLRAAGAGAANKWFYDTWSTEADAWDFRDPRQEPLVLYCSFPSLKDPAHDPGAQQRHTGEVVTFVPWEAFAPWRDTRWKKRGEDYDALKRRLQDILLERFLAKMPGLRSMLVYSELSTPLSTDHFCRPAAGSIYGIAPTPERFANPHLRPRSPIPNLYFAGSEVTSVGVIGAMMGGILAVAAAEPRAALPYLARV